MSGLDDECCSQLISSILDVIDVCFSTSMMYSDVPTVLAVDVESTGALMVVELFPGGSVRLDKHIGES